MTQASLPNRAIIVNFATLLKPSLCTHRGQSRPVSSSKPEPLGFAITLSLCECPQHCLPRSQALRGCLECIVINNVGCLHQCIRTSFPNQLTVLEPHLLDTNAPSLLPRIHHCESAPTPPLNPTECQAAMEKPPNIQPLALAGHLPPTVQVLLFLHSWSLPVAAGGSGLTQFKSLSIQHNVDAGMGACLMQRLKACPL